MNTGQEHFLPLTLSGIATLGCGRRRLIPMQVTLDERKLVATNAEQSPDSVAMIHTAAICDALDKADSAAMQAFNPLRRCVLVRFHRSARIQIQDHPMAQSPDHPIKFTA